MHSVVPGPQQRISRLLQSAVSSCLACQSPSKQIKADTDTRAISRHEGGLTLNDFILADKINDLELSDLMPKRKAKFWA